MGGHTGTRGATTWDGVRHSAIQAKVRERQARASGVLAGLQLCETFQLARRGAKITCIKHGGLLL